MSDDTFAAESAARYAATVEALAKGAATPEQKSYLSRMTGSPGGVGSPASAAHVGAAKQAALESQPARLQAEFAAARANPESVTAPRPKSAATGPAPLPDSLKGNSSAEAAHKEEVLRYELATGARQPHKPDVGDGLHGKEPAYSPAAETPGETYYAAPEEHADILKAWKAVAAEVNLPTGAIDRIADIINSAPPGEPPASSYQSEPFQLSGYMIRPPEGYALSPQHPQLQAAARAARLANLSQEAAQKLLTAYFFKS